MGTLIFKNLINIYSYEQHIYFMQEALNQAKIGFNLGEIPIGTVIVYNSNIIAKAHNKTQSLKNATAHAEIISIQEASKILNQKYLENIILYSTIEPCIMCWGAILNSKIRNICFGANENKTGYTNFLQKIPLYVNVKKNILELECKKLMIDFFKDKRQKL